MAQALVGTSGWTYTSWRGSFYPPNIKSRQYLEFYAKEFPTTEVNYSFYHLPKPQTNVNWAKQVPKYFLFAMKASRLITHMKHFVDVEEALCIFVEPWSASWSDSAAISLQLKRI